MAPRGGRASLWHLGQFGRIGAERRGDLNWVLVGTAGNEDRRNYGQSLLHVWWILGAGGGSSCHSLDGRSRPHPQSELGRVDQDLAGRAALYHMKS